jgi:hypothetical protein
MGSQNCPYPYNHEIWNVNDQDYWCAMCNDYGYPVASVEAPFDQIIIEGKCATFEDEYNACK